MTDGLADGFRVICAVNAVAVSEVQTTGSEDSQVAAGRGAVGRNHNVSARDDFLPLDARSEGNDVAIAVAFDDFAVSGGDDAVSDADPFALVEVHDAQALLVS